MEYNSKTQKKKEAHSLQKLGEQLIKLSAKKIREIGLPVDICHAVELAKTIKQRGALRRQIQYIGTLMRKIDPEPVKEALDRIEMGLHKNVEIFNEAEKYRDDLIDGNNIVIEELLKKYRDADRQQLTQLVRNARKERANNKPPKSSRMLFRYLIKITSEPA